ncbi:hypothetical protein ACFX11_036115 [Malus domestica]
MSAYAGHTKIIEELIRCCPDTCDLVNHKGQTALHAAVLGEKINVVKYVLKTPKLARLINEADNDGNTPWDLAAVRENSKIVAILSRDSRLNRTAMNKGLLQVSNILLAENTGRKEIIASLNVMKSIVVGVKYFQQKIIHEFKKFESQGESSTSETLVNTTNTRENLQAYSHPTFNKNDAKLVVATVIATVTFTALINPPGGFRDDGTPVLKEKAAHKVFSFFNWLSFVLSVFVTYNESHPIPVRSTHLPTPASLISYSIAGMFLAFSAAQMAVQPKPPGQSTVRYFLFGVDTVVSNTLQLIGSAIAAALVCIALQKSLFQTIMGTRGFHNLQNHVI